MVMPKKVESKEHLELAFLDCRNKTKAGQLYVAFFDGNKIKRVNDTYGHLVGDQVIDRIATIMSNNTRDNDRLIRFGGDEFVLFLTRFNDKDIKPFIKRLQTAIRQDKFLIELVGGVSTSVGVVKYVESLHKNLEGVLKSADELMYIAKSSDTKESVFCDDKITVSYISKNRRNSNIQTREYFKYLLKVLLSDNPHFHSDLVHSLIRNYWKSKGESILKEPPNDVVCNIVNSYKKHYKVIMHNYLKKKIKKLNNSSIENNEDIKEEILNEIKKIG